MRGDEPRLNNIVLKVLDFAFLDNPKLAQEALALLINAQSLKELGKAFEICNLADADWNWGRVFIVQVLQSCKTEDPDTFNELRHRWEPWFNALGKWNLREPHPVWVHAVFDVLMRVVPLNAKQEHQLHHRSGSGLSWDRLDLWEMDYRSDGTSSTIPLSGSCRNRIAA